MTCESRSDSDLASLEDVLSRLGYDEDRDIFRQYLVASAQLFAHKYILGKINGRDLVQQESLLLMSDMFLRDQGDFFWPDRDASPWHGKLQYSEASHTQQYVLGRNM